jgi:hypothetical protein
VPVPLGALLGAVAPPDVVVSVVLLEPLGAVLGAGAVVVGGDADGVRSPGRSPTRSVRDSVHAVSMKALSPSAQTAVTILFIFAALLVMGCAALPPRCNACAAARLDRLGDNHYQCGVIPAPAKEIHP